MRIYTPAGNLAFKTFNFPDGQPHFVLETIDDSGFHDVTIETAIKSSQDLFQVLLVAGVLRNNGYSEINLDIRYLMGARMDRAISNCEPFTLQLIARMVNSAGFSRVRILDAHSDVATRLIRNSVNVLPFAVVEQVLTTTNHPVVVCPDKGARDRVRKLYPGIILECSKTRDMATGTLTGFKIDGPFQNFTSGRGGTEVLIIDDICDGGGTFIGLSKILREAGAKKVYLYITHNVQNKDHLEGIDRIFTTDSFSNGSSIHVYSGPDGMKDRVVIPISMEKIK